MDDCYVSRYSLLVPDQNMKAFMTMAGGTILYRQ